MKKRNSPAEIMHKTIIKQVLIPVLEDIKELIKSSVKASEMVLRKEISNKFSKVWDEVKLTQSALKATKEDLENKIDSLGKDLRGEIKDSEIRVTEKLRGEIKDSEIRVTEKLRGEIKDSEIRVTEKLRGEIKDSETRLTEKIDSIHIRVDDHETRIVALEGAGH